MIRLGIALFLILASLASHHASAADPTATAPAPAGATLTGTVRDGDTGEPISGALVSLPELERALATDPEGRYVFRSVPPGPHHIAVRALGYAERTLHALAPREGLLQIDVLLRPKPLRIPPVQVRPPVAVRGLERGDSAALPDREMSIAAVRNDPLLTEPDVFQALGGGGTVLRQEAPSGIHVRGGATEHLAYLIDGIPVFSPHHAAGIASAWNPDALSRLELTSSGLSASDPPSLAGALHGVTRAPGDRVGVQGSVSTTQARLTLDGPLPLRHGSGFLLSLRTGFTGLLSRKDESSNLRGDTADWLARLGAPALGGDLRLTAYESTNEIDAASQVDAPSGAEAPRNQFDWQSRSRGVEWRRRLSTGAARVLAWSAAADARAEWSAEAAPVHLDAERRDTGLLADLQGRTGPWMIRAGVRAERVRTSYRVAADSVSVPDWVLEGRTPIVSSFGRATGRLGSRLELDGRVSMASRSGIFYAAPAGALRWTPFRTLSFSGGAARSHQFVQSLRNAESIVGTIFPADLHVAAGDETRIPAARSDQAVMAADYRPSAAARWTVQGYLRRFDRLVLVAPRAAEPFSLGSFVIGSGRSRGISIDAGVSGARYGITGSYGWQHVRYEHADSAYVPEHGARHLFEGGIIAFPTPTFSIRLGAAAAWGRRTTIASGEFEWEACNLLDRGCEFAGSPHYGRDPLGGATLPPYHRLDLGVRKHWHVAAGGRDVSIALFASATNLLGRRNVLTYARNPATGQVQPIGMRPRSPLVVGLDWRF